LKGSPRRDLPRVEIDRNLFALFRLLWTITSPAERAMSCAEN
jgi:hypothetical protein